MLTASVATHAVRIALAILLDTATLVLWNIGTRSPTRLIADLRAGRQNANVLVRGIFRFLTGSGALVLAATVIAPLQIYGWFFTIGSLVVAFIVEQLIGPDLQSARRSQRR